MMMAPGSKFGIQSPIHGSQFINNQNNATTTNSIPHGAAIMLSIPRSASQHALRRQQNAGQTAFM
jgi:hypothetical protein